MVTPCGYVARIICFTSAVADITVLSGVISILFLFSIWLDLRSVSPTINTYIQLVRHLLLFLFTGLNIGVGKDWVGPFFPPPLQNVTSF